MRIISGDLKGKKIHYIKNNNTRPLRDQIKENIFNIIDHSKLAKVEIKDAEVLDLYSGTGSFGLECLSRGSKKIYFVENDNFSFNILKKNIVLTNFVNKSVCFNLNVNSFLKNNKKKFDIIFFDPPFQSFEFLNEISTIKKFLIYKKKNLVIIHREKKTEDDLENVLKVFLTKTYSRSKILFASFSTQ